MRTPLLKIAAGLAAALALASPAAAAGGGTPADTAGLTTCTVVANDRAECRFVYDGSGSIPWGATSVNGFPVVQVTTTSGKPLFSTFESGQIGVVWSASGDAEPRYRSGSRTYTVAKGTTLVCSLDTGSLAVAEATCG